ncbi:MAG: PadR family transcriptional regulator [Candidatus Bathyarchaeia archaeon]
MRRGCGHHRHIGVPRGLLRYLSLQLLRREPMSGSEIMDQFLEYTDYKPSPGSVYPLLSRLKEDGLVEEIPDGTPSLKRYSLTSSGKEEVDEILKQDNFMKNRHKTIRKIYWRLHRNIPEDLYNSLSALLDAFEGSSRYAISNSEKKMELIRILDEATIKMEEMEVFN